MRSEGKTPDFRLLMPESGNASGQGVMRHGILRWDMVEVGNN
jgi:hypothetical protein